MPGYYLKDAFASNCTICPAGHKCTEGSTTALACADGEYAVAGSTTCTKCPAGFYCDSKFYPSMKKCGLGTYAAVGSTQCQACPAGKYCTGSEAKDCPSGMYSK